MLDYDWLTMLCSSRQQRDSAIHMHVSILPHIPLPSRLPGNMEQSSLCYTVGPSWLSILFIFLKNNFIYLFVFGSAGSPCGFFSSCGEWGLLSSWPWASPCVGSLAA